MSSLPKPPEATPVQSPLQPSAPKKSELVRCFWGLYFVGLSFAVGVLVVTAGSGKIENVYSLAAFSVCGYTILRAFDRIMDY